MKPSDFYKDKVANYSKQEVYWRKRARDTSLPSHFRYSAAVYADTYWDLVKQFSALADTKLDLEYEQCPPIPPRH